MKLLTLNTHSLIGESFGECAMRTVDALVREEIDLIALQEVNQSTDAPPLEGQMPNGFVPCGASIPLRADNYVYRLAEVLEQEELPYFWCWLPIKRAYGRYDEGLAFLSREPIEEMRVVALSQIQDYENWKTRMALGVRLSARKAWFFNLHMGWWDDPEEPFAEQWRALCARLPKRDAVWLMGDFNNPAEVRTEGYDLVAESGFFDAYLLAGRKNGEATVCGDIDGWHGRIGKEAILRIDQIWCNRPSRVHSYRTVFDGRCYERVSDHAGVLIDADVCGVRRKGGDEGASER